MKYVDGKFVSTPIIVTPNSTLSFMQTADIEGRTTVDADGNYKTVFFMNPDSKKTFTPPEVVMPDADSKYKKLLFTFNITPGNSDTVKSDFCYTSMIHFNGSADCDLFKGKVVRECIDTRVQFNDQVQTLSARYVLSGTDKSGNPCKIYVENNGIDNGRMVTTPQIITDSPDYAWIETAPLHGTVDQTSGLKILMWTTEE